MHWDSGVRVFLDVSGLAAFMFGQRTVQRESRSPGIVGIVVAVRGSIAPFTDEEAAAFELLSVSRDRLQYYIAETQENLAFVQALCRAAA